jgi:uncharacterized protein (DUF302 family)
MPQDIGLHIDLPFAFADAVNRVRNALKQEGFGILTEIDLQAAFREKLGRDFRPYVILGACNPPLAFSAVSADASVGLLLPCNVTVEAVGEMRTVVRLTNPQALLGGSTLAGSPALADVARDASERMSRVAGTLGEEHRA